MSAQPRAQQYSTVYPARFQGPSKHYRDQMRPHAMA